MPLPAPQSKPVQQVPAILRSTRAPAEGESPASAHEAQTHEPQRAPADQEGPPQQRSARDPAEGPTLEELEKRTDERDGGLGGSSNT